MWEQLYHRTCSCVQKRGFITLHYNRQRSITASVLKEVCLDFWIEAILQKLTGKRFEQRTANTLNEAKLDVAARGFQIVGQIAFFDTKVFCSNATRYVKEKLQQCYTSNENEKKKKYNTRVMELERGCFTLLVFSENRGMGCECKGVLLSIS